ncbi:MAG: GNAT family protein [Methanobacteriaceae archaeon]|nr:GNAT family protein [Methanobacteriaceae archaeon]
MYTKDLILDNIKFEDVWQLYELWSNDNVMKYMGIKPDTTIKNTEKRIFDIHEAYNNGTKIHWSIHIKKTNKIIGTCALQYINNNIKNTEIAYELLPDYQKKGYMTQTLPVIINFAYNILQLEEIYAIICEKANDSIKQIKKHNFKYNTTLENYITINNKKYNAHIYKNKKKG